MGISYPPQGGAGSGSAQGGGVAVSGLTITDIAAREITTENVTTTLTPAVGESFVFNHFGESLTARIVIVEWSSNGGSNFFDPGADFTGTSAMGTTTGTVKSSPINVHVNGGSRMRWTNPANAGNYIIARIGTSYS